jgi:hypothetical protein
MPGETEPARAERIALDQLCARRDVRPVDRSHQIRLRDTQLRQRAVQRHPAGVKHRAHRAVADQHLRAEAREQHTSRPRLVEQRCRAVIGWTPGAHLTRTVADAIAPTILEGLHCRHHCQTMYTR